MGSTLGCVKEPKEAGGGGEPAKAPFSPKRKKKKGRFRRRRKGRKGTPERADPAPEGSYEAVAGAGEELQQQDDEAERNLSAAPSEVEGKDLAKRLHQNGASKEPDGTEEGCLVQVRERFQGELQRAHLVTGKPSCSPSSSKAGSPRDPLEEGTTVIARLRDNPAELNREKVNSQVVAHQRWGSSLAVLVPWPKEEKEKEKEEKEEEEEEDSVVVVCRSWDQPKPEVPLTVVEEAWNAEDVSESISWGASWSTAEKGTVSELSTPSPLADQAGNQEASKLQRTPAGQEPPAGTWAKMPASQSKSSFSGSTSSTFWCSSGYGSDPSHTQGKAHGNSPHEEDPQRRTPAKRDARPDEGGISDIYISGTTGDLTAKEKLLLWTQKVTAGYVPVKCTNFSSCWNDGKMFNAIIHRYRPDLVDMQRVEIQSSRENLEQAFEIAERLGVTRLLDAEDVDVDSPDEKSVITYVSSIYDAFPKVPEGGDGISATEVDRRWTEYQGSVESLLSWVKQHTIIMSDKSFPQNPVELKALYNEYIHFKETEIPAKQQEKRSIEELYKLLEVWIEFGRMKLPQGFHPNDVDEEWGKLVIEMLEREKLLRPAVERLELLLQIANKIQNGTLCCEEKLTLARNTLQADEAHLESAQAVQHESDVVLYLQECEELLYQLQADVQILRDENYYQLEELVVKMVRLQDELVTLKLECANLYRKGHFTSSSSSPSSDIVQPSSLHTGGRLKANPLLKGLHTATTASAAAAIAIAASASSWFRKPMSRSELVAASSSEDEGNLRFVYELLAWVEEMQMKLERAEWGNDLPSVQSQLEVQRSVHSGVEDLGSSVKEARMYENKMSQNFRTSYTETLGKLEVQYCKLMETSSFRLRHLQSLYEFVSLATAELIWLNGKEEEELAYDWSDNNPNMAAKRNYFTELTMELEEKQNIFHSLQDTAELFSLENHPAKQTVEAYRAAMQTQWQWIRQLCLCVEQHVKENTAYFQFFSDARDSESYLKSLQDAIKRKYSCDRNTSLTRLEDLLQDSMDEKEQLIQAKSSVASLVGRSKSIVQLKPRNPDHVLEGTISVKAVCDYRQIEITICRNDECVLEDNSQRIQWKVISPTGNEAMVPSVCFLVSPPNKEAIDVASRVEQLYQKTMALWHKLHINMKSLVSWNYLKKDISVVQGWSLEKLRALPSGECHQAMRNLQLHYDDFLEDSRDSELFSAAHRLRLKEEVDACKEKFQQLMQSMENEDKDETASRTYLSELKNIRLHLDECEQRLVGTIRTPSSTRTDGDALQENTFRIAEQERLKEDLQNLKADLEQFSERCSIFLLKSPTGSSTPHLRSELNLLVEKMGLVHGLSSVYLDKLKTVDVIIRNTQGAESLVKGYEVKLSQEEAVPTDLAAIRAHQTTLQQWTSEVKDKKAVFTALEEDLSRAKVVAEQLFRLKQERSVDLERYQEKGAQLWERWQRVGLQVETRQSDLESIQDVLGDYRSCHGALIRWIEETTAQQEAMKPGQAEDSRVLSEQLSQQMALFAEIEANQAKLDQCQKLSQQYSAAVKDYELQLMAYRAFVESQQKSPVKRRRMLSSSDTITQEFMDLRTRYTALVTLTTQHVKYISDALRRLEEEEKVVEEEKLEHVDKVKALLGWVSNFKQSSQFKNIPPESKDLGDIEKSILEQQVLNEELAAKKEQVSEAIKTAQMFVARHNNKLSGQEKEVILAQLDVLRETYDQLCSESSDQLQQLQSHMAQETAHKGTETVAGVLDLGTMEVVPIWGAMQKGLLDQETGLLLLEAQVASGGLLVPDTGEKISLSEGLAKDIIDAKTYAMLQELQSGVQLVNSHDFQGKPLLPLAAAMEDGTISERVGLTIAKMQILAGGLHDPSSDGRIGLEEALQGGMIPPHLHEKMASCLDSCKTLIDPNSAKKTGLSELQQQCLPDPETGLRLLPVHQLAGGMVSLTSGQKVNIFRAVQEGLIEMQVAVRLLEAQLFAGGIVDPKSGHRLTVEEAARHNLIDQDLACALLVRQMQTGGIVDTVTGERLSLDEAVRKDLVEPRMAVATLESLWSFMGLLQPESGEILPVATALDRGILSSELADEILSKRQHIEAVFIPETREIMSWEKIMDAGILSQDAAKTLKSMLLPDVMPNVPLADSPPGRVRNISPTNRKDQSEECKERMLFYLMTHSYVDACSGQKLLLLTEEELNTLADIVEPTIEKDPHSQPMEERQHQPKGWEVVEDRMVATVESEPHSELAWKELELNLSAPQKELERNLMPGVCFPIHWNEREAGDLPGKEVERGMKVKEEKEVDSLEGFGSEMGGSKREAEQIMIQNASEADLLICESIEEPSPGKELRDIKITLDSVKFDKQPAEEEMMFSEEQKKVSEMERSYIEKESRMAVDLQSLKENVMKKAILAATSEGSEVNLLNAGKVENGSIESLICQDEGKISGEPIKEEEAVSGEGRVGHSDQTESVAFPKPSTEEGDDTLHTLITQLYGGGIINEQTGKRMLLDESVSCGVLPGHTAIKLMGELKLFGGFFDAESCEALTTEEVIHEGLMDETLLQKVLDSDQAISGVVDPRSKAIYSITDASEVGLLDKETAARILEGQVVTGGIADVKRGKKVSVTLASKLGLVERPIQEELKKLEKASKGKGMDGATKEKLISLQAEIGGIVDPKTKEPLTVPQAVEKGLLSKEKASEVLMKQIVDGGILHHKTGMRLSVEDALVHKLIDQGLYDNLRKAENVCFHQYIHPETKELISLPQAVALGLISSGFQSKVQGMQASTGSVFDPVSHQKIPLTKAVKEGLLPKAVMEKAVTSADMKHAILDPESCGLVPYSELVRKSRIDIESGQRYLEVVPFRDLKDERTGNVLLCPQAVKLGKVEPALVSRLLQAQAESGGIVEPATGQRLSLADALERGMVDEDMAKAIAVSQLSTGGIVSTERGQRLTLMEAVEMGLVSKKLASAIQESALVISDDVKGREDCQPQLLLQNGTSKTDASVIGEYSAESNEEKQSVLFEGTGSKMFEEVPVGSLKDVQEILEEMGDSVPPSLPLPSGPLLGEGKMESELALMLDPVGALQLKAQKKDMKRKSRLRREELQRGEVEKPGASEQVMEKEWQNVTRNERINGEQEQNQRVNQFAQEESDRTDLASEPSQRTICLHSLETSNDPRENEKVGIESEVPATVDESQTPTSEEALFGDTKIEPSGMASELRSQDPNASESTCVEVPKKMKKKTKRNRKQVTATKDPAQLPESSHLRPSEIPILVSKEVLVQRTSAVQKSSQGNISGKKVRGLLKPEEADDKREDREASGKEEKGGKENITDDQKVSTVPTTDAFGELAQQQEIRTDQDSPLALDAVEIKIEEKVFQEKAQELRLSNDEVPKLVAIDDTQTFVSSETEVVQNRTILQGETGSSASTPSLSQDKTIQGVTREDDSIAAKGLTMDEEPEETRDIDCLRSKISSPEEWTLQRSGYPEGKRDPSPKTQDSVSKLAGEKEKADELSSAVEGREERPPDAPKLTKTPLSKQLCLDHDEKLVALLSRVRDVEMRIQRVPLLEQDSAALQDLLRQAEALDAELQGLSSPVSQGLEAAQNLLASPPLQVPEQLLKALEKDAKNLQKSFSSVSEALASWLTNLQAAAKEEEKTKVRTRHEELQRNLQGLLTWVSDTTQSLNGLDFPGAKTAEDPGALHSCLQSYKDLKEPLADTKAQLDAAALDIQFFISENAQDLSPEQSRQLLRLLNELQGSFRELSGRVAAQTEVLRVCLLRAEQTDQTLQEQQVIRSRNLEELCSWMNQAEARLQDPQGAMHKGELSLLEQKQSDIKDLQRNMHSRSASFAGILKATEEFMEDNQAKLDPQELASLRARHGQAKEQLQSLQERVEATHKELESAVSTVVQQQTQKVKAVKDFEENHNKIESLLHWMSSLEKSRESTKSRSLSLSQKAGDQKDGRTPDTPDGRPVEADRVEEGLDLHFQSLKAHHQELLSQQQEVLLSAQSAQAFLEKRGHNLSPAETQQLQGKLDELKDQYASKLSQSEAQLKQVQSLQDELQKFLRDHLEFEAWLLQAEQELDRMHHGDGGLEALRPMLHRQSSFSEDVISHKGDLRFVTMSGQKVLDAEKATAGPEVSSTGALVTSKLEDATKRYGTLHSKCAALGSHLNLLLDRSQQFQDIANALQTWLQRSEAAVSNLLSEPISSDPAILQKQLASAKRLQEDLAEHQVPVEKLEKASRSLLEIHQAPVPDHKSIQETTASVMSRFQGLWGRMAERSDLLQKAIAQSQSVQEGLEGLARSMAHIEESLQRQEGTPFSAAAVQEALANNTKLKQDLDRQRSLLEATQGMVARFAEAAESGAAAAALRSQLDSLTERFGSLCQRRQKEEETLKELLPKVEQHEQLSQALEQFTETRGRMLAAGNQPHHDIGHFSQQIQELNSEMKQRHEDLEMLESLTAELSACGFAPAGSSSHQEKVRSLRKDFAQLQKTAREREKGASSCQEQLDEFRKLVGSMRHWMQETEAHIPPTETSLGTHELEKRMQQIEVLLEEWAGKGVLVEEIGRRGTALESLIVEITAPDAQSKTGSVPPSGGSVASNSVNGYHTCKDLTEIQCDVSDVNLRYEGLGGNLRGRREQAAAILAKMREAKEEVGSALAWLESQERALDALEASASPSKPEAVRAQAEHNKVFLTELEQNSVKVQKAKESLSGLLQKYPDSPEAGNWKRTLEDLDSRWERANQVTTERQQKLEKSARELASFQVAEGQLRPWLTEKELMMSVLGPLSIDPNMLSAQKQQVQFMLKEFESRKPQFDQLNAAAQGMLTGPEASPSAGHMQDDLQAINQTWTALTERLDSRSAQIDQAMVKSTQFQALLQSLSEKVKAAGQRLSPQLAASTQPEAVKRQLEEASEVRSDLEQLENNMSEAQALCEELSVLIGEQYLKDELKKRMEAVALPLRGLQDLAADRMNRLQTALASSQQFQQMFDELQVWLDEKVRCQAQAGPISAKLERLQTQIQEQEELQKSLNQHSGSYEMIVAEGESLLVSARAGEEKARLQGQLTNLKARWEELSKQAADRHAKLKDCLQKAQKYQRHVEDLFPWVEDCRSKVTELEVTLDPVQLEATLLRSKAMLSDVEKRRSLLEMLNSAADVLINASEMDEDDVRDEKAGINQKMDAITEELQAKAGSLEEMSQRLKEFQESLRNIEKKLEGTKHQLEIYETLGPQACSNKNLEKLRSQQEALRALAPQVDYLKNFTRGLVEDAPDGSDSSHLLRQAEAAQREFEEVGQKVSECCTLMESKLEGIGQFSNHVREMFSQLADLDDELDGMSPVGRDLDSLQSQAEDMHDFLGKLQRLKQDIQASEEKCREMLDDEGSPDLVGLRRELETIHKQCGKLADRGRGRLEQVEAALSRLRDFYGKLRELTAMAATAEESEALQWVVGTEVEAINQQLADFKLFQKEQVDPIQLKLQEVNGIGQGLIQSAGKNSDVQGLEHDMEDINARWNTLNKKVAHRTAQLQEALLHCGKFQDALEPLLSWLTDTEELISNQKPPSAEYKVVKAQIQEQKLLQRLLDDRKATVEMIHAEGGRIAQSAEPADREKIAAQLESLGGRWEGLLSKAMARQNQLEEILVLAKQFHETSEPISDWLSVTEKKLANSEPIGTQTPKIQQQITRHKALAEETESHAPAVAQAVSLGQSLSALSCRPDQASLAEKLDLLQSRYAEVCERCGRKAALLDQALVNARLFGEDEVEVLNWLGEVQVKLDLVAIKDYKWDVLHRQHADQMTLNDEIMNRKKNVDQAIKNGQALLKQTTGEEVLLIQEKLDGIKTRYADITASSAKALRTLEQARQLAAKFQSTYEELTAWMSQVEQELGSGGGLSPVGEQIPQFQQRQKDLKKQVMERRLVLDTVNEVSRALSELVPWRARGSLEKTVSDTNEHYKQISDTIKQRVEEIDAAIQRSQQYEQAADAELAWVAETKRKLMALGPVRLEQEHTTAQLQVQKAFSIDIIRHKDSVDELLSQRDDIFGTCGKEQKAILQEKTESLLQQYDDISHLNSERYARLERAQVLVNQFWETHEELNPWLEETQTLIGQLPPPAIDYEHLKQQQEDMRQLRESIAEHKPHIDKLLKIGPQLKELNPEEGEMVQEKYQAAETTYLHIKEEVRQRALALDEAVSQSTQFHDKIEPMLETLESLSSRLRMPPLIPAEVEKIRECISENKNATMELEKLQPSFQALKRRGEELVGRSQGIDKDPAAKEIQDKLDKMLFFWEDIRARAEEREIKFLDVLELAEKFWYDMAALLTTIRDTQDIVHDLESPGIDPSIIKQQMEAAETIKAETDSLHEELEFIRILGTDLIFACGETEKPEVKKSIDEMNSAWENLNKTWKERLERLEEAMQSAVLYQDTLQAMFDWLDNTVIKLCNMPPVGTDLNTVKEQLKEMKEFKTEVYQQQIEMEKLNHQGEIMLKKAADETDRDIIRRPLTELKHLWENLGDKIADRQHKLEGALLALGQFQHALAELMAWLTHTEQLLDAQKPIKGDPKVIEVELAKHHVLKNDVLAHQATVETVNKAGDELLQSTAGDDASKLRDRLDAMVLCWETVLCKTEEREQQLQMTLQQAQGFHGEIDDFLQWLTRMENQLSASKPTGGLPETAREQLNAHMELYAQFKANETVFGQLLDKGRFMLLGRDDCGSGSKTEQSVALLEQKWNIVSSKMEERKTKLEEALRLAAEFQNSLQDFINWLTFAEQSLNVAPPPSLILTMVLSQIEDHKVFANEVNAHRDQIIGLDQSGNQLKFLSQKQDVVLIKNLLVSVQSRWEKVVQRSVERGRALDDARKRAKQFHEAWKKLVDWLEDAENHLDSDLEISNDPDKIKLQLSKHKEFQKTLGGKQPVYDTTIRTGRALKEKAQFSDDGQSLDHLLGEVRDRWDTVCGKSVERQHKLEEALLFSGQFMDALQALVDWLYKVEPQLAEDQPVHGDLDLVMNLIDAHKVFQKELGKRTGTVQVLKRSGRELIENSRDDTTWVKVQLQELSNRWDTVCKMSVLKQIRLEQAFKQAEEFRTAVHLLLDWLSEAEQTLRFRGALPDDAEALQSLIDTHKEFMKKVEEKISDVTMAVGMGEVILAVCHPDCITTIKHWITIIRARFEEVLAWAKQHQQRLEAALSELVANAQLLEQLLAWIQWAETALIQRDQDPMPQNIDQVKALIAEHQSFMEEMTRKQPDVDRVTKTYKRKATEPSHGPLSEKSRSNRKSLTQPSPPLMPVLSQSEAKNPRINQLSARWQQVWLLALERQRKLNDALDRLEELKEFANFDFDVWRKKYMRWMNHKKSRVMDFFRRIDKDQDGKITRQEFIDGILASKFPTTKLEMTAVADIFDRDGDGYIDYYEFVAALHPNKDAYRPTTDADKIEDEVTRQVAQCKCAKRFQVEQIGENKYRFFLGNQFGDSQQLRLVRILRSTVMVRVGGGWMALDEFLVKNDPCRVHHPGSKIKRSDSSSSIASQSPIARGRTNLELREKFILPEGASQGMAPFRSRGRRSKPSSRAASPTRSSSSASQSNHSCTSMPSSPATPASGTKVAPSSSSKLKRPTFHSSRTSLAGDTSNSSSPVSSGAKTNRADPKKTTSRPTSRAGSRASSRRGSDASDFDLETQSACSDTSESSATGGQGGSRRGTGAKPSKIPTITKKTPTANTAVSPKMPGARR
ncbi:microtubule-actin cross-linking factor 1 isoform X5 [Anolis carolinensis]|uniref:microtubule-actin cross-linking factor 1 isoform X5 n=1 Tax=Anolis carolinensis TaxID=28377 RepID=UPI002F2B86BC